MIAAVKFLHLAALTIWCAALLALPLLLRAHGRAGGQTRFVAFRLITHTGYTAIATPAALVAIAAGTGLIFLAGVFQPWLLVKLALVAGMVLVHVWFGHAIQRSGETRRPVAGAPILGLALALPLIAGVLWLALAKPSGFERLLPVWALAPQGPVP